MSNSYKKQPIGGNVAGSDKKDKRLGNRAYRKKVKQSLTEDVEILPELNEVSHVWSHKKDGKNWFGDCDKEDVIKWCRK